MPLGRTRIAFLAMLALLPNLNDAQFWDLQGGPEDILREMAWVRHNDGKARAIATRGQQLAATYLNGQARTCYWWVPVCLCGYVSNHVFCVSMLC